MTSTVAVTLDATAVVGAMGDFVMEMSPKNSDLLSESTCGMASACCKPLLAPDATCRRSQSMHASMKPRLVHLAIYILQTALACVLHTVQSAVLVLYDIKKCTT